MDNESVAGSDDEAPEDDEHQAGESTSSTSSSSNAREAEKSDGEVEGSTSQSSQSSSESDGEMPVLAATPSKRQGRTQPQKKPRQVPLVPPSCPRTLTARPLKQN